MPTTRSSTKQTRIDDFKDSESNITSNSKIVSTDKIRKSAKAPKPKSTHSIPRKRPSGPDLSSNKRPKTQDNASSQRQKQHNDLEKPIKINRSPVLQLWAATVCQFTHPDLSWQTCLSIGNAISALCAVSKGRGIGVIEPKSKQEDQNKERKANSDTQERHVMGFPISLEGSKAMAGGMPKTLNESTLQNKFGHEEYDSLRKAMALGLEAWKQDLDELGRRAFGMYEEFRPRVPKGQSGWGRKGEIYPEEVTRIIESTT